MFGNENHDSDGEDKGNDYNNSSDDWYCDKIIVMMMKKKMSCLPFFLACKDSKRYCLIIQIIV